ncbi:hypothetical protein B5180_13780 [Streptomyces sp. BF-3]|nr:hypothetical protein B5180_13780 [Streptomyces sp. BF-3]
MRSRRTPRGSGPPRRPGRGWESRCRPRCRGCPGPVPAGGPGRPGGVRCRRRSSRGKDAPWRRTPPPPPRPPPGPPVAGPGGLHRSPRRRRRDRPRARRARVPR